LRLWLLLLLLLVLCLILLLLVLGCGELLRSSGAGVVEKTCEGGVNC